MSRPLLLDLFCGAGGAAVGYHRAGFDVSGRRQPTAATVPVHMMFADVVLAFSIGLLGLAALTLWWSR